MPDLYGKLLEWRRAEATSRGLAKLPPDFYDQCRIYIAEARRTFESELRQDPGGRKGEVARQTHQRAGQLARDIVEARMNKILTHAFQAGVGVGHEVGNSLPEERGLYEQLIQLLRGFRGKEAPYLEPGGGSPATSPPPNVPTSEPETGRSAGRGAGERALPPVAWVRVLRSSPPIEIGGEKVELRQEDVLSVTPEIARILVEGKVAESIAARDPAATDQG